MFNKNLRKKCWPLSPANNEWLIAKFQWMIKDVIKYNSKDNHDECIC